MSDKNSDLTGVFYIKDRTLFSAETKEYIMPIDVTDIDVPRQSENYLTSNKILITDLEKIKKKRGKSVFLSNKIGNFDKVKARIVSQKSKNSKSISVPKSDDYDFIEKSSAILVIEGVLSSFDKNSFEDLKGKINAYVKFYEKNERSRIAQIDEQIEIESSKVKKLKDEKGNFKIQNIDSLAKNIKSLNSKISSLESDISVLEKQLSPGKEDEEDEKVEEMMKRIKKIDYEVKNLELEIKIVKAKITSLKEEIKMGKKKHINIWLFILTLGLIYWTRFSDCKYQVLKLNKKINKMNEKILIYEKKKFNIQNELDDILTVNKKANLKKSKSREEIISQISEKEDELKDNEKEFKKLEKELESKNHEMTKFDSQINKAEEKLIELSSVKDEYLKYSCKRVLEVLGELESERKKSIDEIKQLKKDLEGQKIDIEGEWIFREE